MTPAGTPNELDVQNEWEENTHTYRLLYVLDKNAAPHNTGRRTAAGRLIALCTYLELCRGTARDLRSFWTCKITRMQLKGAAMCYANSTVQAASNNNAMEKV